MKTEDYQFACEQMAQTLSAVKPNRHFTNLQTAIKNIYDHDDLIPYGEEHDGKIYHFYQSTAYPLGVYRVTDTASFRRGKPDWQLLFTVADLAAVLATEVYLSSYSHNSLQPQLMLLTLTVPGGERYYTLEFDLKQCRIINDGFNLPLSASFMHYRDADSVWVCPAWEAGQRGSGLYSNEVRLWRRGSRFSAADLVFKGTARTLMVEAWRYLDPHGAPLDLIKEYLTYNCSNYYIIMADLTLKSVKIPQNAEICGYLRGFLLIRLKSKWSTGGQIFTADNVIAAKLTRGVISTVFTIFTPGAGQTVEKVETSENYVFIHYLDKVKSRAAVFLFTPPAVKAIVFPDLPTINFELIDQPRGSDIFYLSADDLIHAPVLYTWDAAKNELCILRRQRDLFRTANLKLEQLWATAPDGTAVPYFWCGNNRSTLTPTVVYCYGGFGVNLLPHYMPVSGKLWLEKGGAFVIANLRGGGELGTAWHRAATGKNKMQTVADLEAVVRDLHQRGFTAPSRTAVQGGSNGGLIVSNLMVRVPELLQAVIAEVPLLDMNNYQSAGAGCLWTDEYGDPQDPEITAVLKNLTVYSRIKPLPKLPRLLLMSNTADERVDPGQALLLYRLMLKNRQSCVWYCSAGGGHEFTGSLTEEIATLAYLWFFLYNALDLPFTPY